MERRPSKHDKFCTTDDVVFNKGARFESKSSERGDNGDIAGSLKTEEAFIGTKEAAAFLGISEGELRNKVSCGKVPFYKLGRSNRYLRSELIGLLQPKGVRNGN